MAANRSLDPAPTTPRPARFGGFSRTAVAMDTLVTITVDSAPAQTEIEPAVERALRWFAEVEAVCSRFDPSSELVRLSTQAGGPVAVSELLFQAIAFALEVAELTDGAFDPTVGGVQLARGLTRDYVTGADLSLPLAPACYRDVLVDRARHTVTLAKPLLLDLGAVAKGLAIDLAARELAAFERFAVDAGGDLFMGGSDTTAPAWRVGIQHPRGDGLLGTIAVVNAAVCTSGGYERAVGGAGDGTDEHHILDPRSQRSPRGIESVTVVAPAAMVADAAATAAFVLGAAAGLRFLEEQGLAGIITTTDGVLLTPGCEDGLAWSPQNG